MYILSFSYFFESLLYHILPLLFYHYLYVHRLIHFDDFELLLYLFFGNHLIQKEISWLNLILNIFLYLSHLFLHILLLFLFLLSFLYSLLVLLFLLFLLFLFVLLFLFLLLFQFLFLLFLLFVLLSFLLFYFLGLYHFHYQHFQNLLNYINHHPFINIY